MTQDALPTGLLRDPVIFESVTGQVLPDNTDHFGASARVQARLDFFAAGSIDPYSDLDFARLVVAEYMGLFETHEVTAAKRALPQIKMRAASHLRAKADPSPTTIEPVMMASVEKIATRQPYTDYFAVREDELAFPRFAGGLSPVVKRTSFLGGDAVTVLPFDPDLNVVLLVRQFRHGPFARGDTNPWTLEPAAGRIDPGETPEETARRELLEETGVTADAVQFVGRYYPSPGAFSEYLYSYVALADLAARDGRVGGLDDEAEDIMAHVLPLEHALGMIETGEVNTGPLILSLQWLALNAKTIAPRT